jgi:hypothetical protein
MSSLLALSDVGFRRFGSLLSSGEGVTPEQAAAAAAQCGDYEVAGAWVRRRARKKGPSLVQSFKILDVLDQSADLTNERLAFVDHYFRSEFANTPLPRLTTESENILGLVESAGRERRPLGMYRLNQALAYAGPQRLKPVLRDHVAPCFFNLYPRGKIVVISYNADNDNAAALMRTLYAAAQTPLAEVRQRNFSGIGTLQNWHLNSLTLFGPLLFDLFLYLFYPFVGGYRAGLVGLDFVFLFEPAEKYVPDLYPRNWLAIASTAADFGRERVNLYESLRGFQGPAWQHAAHQRFQYEQGYTVAARLALLEWYVRQVNRLLYELTDVANFTEGNAPDRVIDPVFGFEHYLAVDRLARKTLLSMSLEEAGTAKLMTFEVAELFDTLSLLFRGTLPTDFFKDLFHPVEGPALLRSRLARLPPPFDADLPALADRMYQEIQQTVIDSVWLRTKVTPSDVLVRDRALAVEKPIPHADFVAELIRCYRNGHHGYFTASDKQARPSRYLYLAEGDLSAEVSGLPALWWLAYLADPRLVGWQYLPVGQYD